MDQDKRSDIGILTRDVESAFLLAQEGQIEVALLVLEEAELKIGSVSVGADDADRLELRMFCWLLLVRATLLVDCGRLSDAELVAGSVLSLTTSAERNCFHPANSCLIREYARAAMIMASIFASRGRFNMAFEMLKNAWKIISESDQLHLEKYMAEVLDRVDDYGSALGYTSLSTALERRTTGEGRKVESESGAGWAYPLPLSGPAEPFKRRYNELHHEIYGRGQLPPIEKGEKLTVALELVDEWKKVVPYSIEARSIQFELHFSLAITRIQTDEIEDFDYLFSEIEQEVEQLLTDAPENIDLGREVAIWLYSLSNAIFSHVFADQETRIKFFLLAERCISGAYEFLDQLRATQPVTQAIALNASSVSNLVAKANDYLGQGELAADHRLRRDRILDEVLLRDPRNDRALRLAELYKLTRSAFKSSEISDVSSWNWSIDPLI